MNFVSLIRQGGDRDPHRLLAIATSFLREGELSPVLQGPGGGILHIIEQPRCVDLIVHFALTPASGWPATTCQTVFCIVSASAGSTEPYGAVGKPTGDCFRSVAK